MERTLAAKGAKHVLEVKLNTAVFDRVREIVIDLLFERSLHEVIAQMGTLFCQRHQYEANVRLVWVILEQLDRGLTGSEHGRDEDDLEVDLIDILATAGTLG